MLSLLVPFDVAAEVGTEANFNEKHQGACLQLAYRSLHLGIYDGEGRFGAQAFA